ncbi:unnamed protein product [Ilex paraguariensis]|uniref:mitogen-activated protein kinase kinase kinase n=1 Tax=Ilex paraguariensis TaxID=185542 RepID=A0ABC8TAP1_9AQUA
MPWWQSAFSSSSASSSSSSSSSKSYSDDSLLHRIGLRSLRGGRRVRSQQRRLTRARQLRYLPDHIVGDPQVLWRSPSALEHSTARSSSAVVPQPLPLPELALLLRRDANLVSNSTSGNVPLPSPKNVASKGGGEERERTQNFNEDANGDGVTSNTGLGSRLVNQDARKSMEHAETRSSRKSRRELNGAESIRDNYRINIPVSAPTSSFSSPAISPQRSTGDYYAYQYMTPQVFQIWSAPEMPPSDMTPGLGLPPQISPEKNEFSMGSSPLHSPKLSPHRNTVALGGPASPILNKSAVEASMARPESIAQATVHALPLPPGAAVSPQPAVPPPQVTAKAELMPIKCQWQKGKLIGRGTFGSVYVASNLETGALCAMKEVEILPDDAKSAECIRQLEQEIKVLSQLKHPNIVQYYGSEMVGDRFHIYLEYVHPGSINKYIRDHCRAITESVVRNFTRHILCGLAYLHSTKTIHRDIKGANLLVDAYGVVKLADFGMAKHLTGQAANLSLKGSPYWMAPELLQSAMQKDTCSDLALAVDIWSLGCTIIEMLNGKPPWSEYEGAAAMFRVLKENPPIPETLSAEGKDFLHCCFRRNPAERPSASMLLEHRFVKSSQQLDLSSCIQSFNGMKLKDKAHSQREQSRCKLDQLQVSTQTTKGKLVNNSSFMHDSFSPVRLGNDLVMKLPT